MRDITKKDKVLVVKAIERNSTILNAVVLLIVFTLLFLNLKLLFKILNYIPSFSMVAMITIIAGLVLLSLYLSKCISKSAIEKFEAYDQTLNDVLASLRYEIKERERTEAKFNNFIMYDQLTGLPNRTQFMRRLNRIGERKTHHKDYLFAVLFIDLDNFKNINDSLGQTIGNDLLISVAQRLQMCIRSIDTLSRFGGDEFALILDSINDERDVLLVIKRIEKKLKKVFSLNGHNIFISSSIGVVLSSTEHDHAEDLLRNAEIAVHQAKDNGKSRYEMFDVNMHDSIMRRLKLEADLRLAIKHNEFFLNYQPLVSLKERRIVGTEALIRWKHPKLGSIPPLEFIPIAEDAGLISDIGEWVLRTACIQNKIWHDAGYNYLRIDINFSSRQFHNQNLVEQIKKVLRETGMRSDKLDIEITESVAMEDNSIDVLDDLNNMKITTSVDDFGTGHSSLGSLKRLPINALKIDKSFIQDVTIDADSEAIVRTVIAMAHNLNLKVVAEGVETAGQLELLHSNHCDEIQGYLLSPPISADEFFKLLQQESIGLVLNETKNNNNTVKVS
jgi:diguanylate cyclase (GGDEF)-like protein